MTHDLARTSADARQLPGASTNVCILTWHCNIGWSTSLAVCSASSAGSSCSSSESNRSTTGCCFFGHWAGCCLCSCAAAPSPFGCTAGAGRACIALGCACTAGSLCMQPAGGLSKPAAGHNHAANTLCSKRTMCRVLAGATSCCTGRGYKHAMQIVQLAVKRRAAQQTDCMTTILEYWCFTCAKGRVRC